MFGTPDEAQSFRERAAEKMRSAEAPGVKHDRSALGEMVAQEMEAAGHPVDVITHPWEHTREEHDEAQALVDLAFEKDLPAAMRAAERSEHYPRVLDLFHDVLTNEMYPLIVQHKLNRQGLAGWVLLAAGVVAAVIVLTLSFLILTV